MKNKIYAILIISLFIMLAFSLVMAVNNPNNGNKPEKYKNHLNDSNFSSSNANNSFNNKMNYGLCVANYTKIKDSCYRFIKEGYKECVNNAKNISRYNLDLAGKNVTIKKEIISNRKIMFGDCRNERRAEIVICKDAFKLNKDSCMQYKCKQNQTIVNGLCIFS